MSSGGTLTKSEREWVEQMKANGQAAKDKDPRKYGDPRFLALLDSARELHCKKAADYGSGEDPLANIRASEEIGIPAHKGAWLRAKDKVRRIDNFYKNGKLSNEGVIDSLVDLAAYCYIAAILLEEVGEKAKEGV